MSDDRTPSGRDADPARLGDLQARIDKARGAARDETGRPRSDAPRSSMAAAFRLSTELFAGVIVGGGLGWAFDRALGTTPFGLIGFILVGFAAGTMNLVRAAGRPSGRSGSSEPGSGA